MWRRSTNAVPQLNTGIGRVAESVRELSTLSALGDKWAGVAYTEPMAVQSHLLSETEVTDALLASRQFEATKMTAHTITVGQGSAHSAAGFRPGGHRDGQGDPALAAG
jgi:hypothetical protein